MNNDKSSARHYICIDLKSFYASCECVERGLDPFAANLVVADPERGGGSICLAVSPAMKALGVPGRCRVFEIPTGIKYITAPPRMSLYLRKSAEIFSIYLRFVSPDDIHVYSVDECFIDITGYKLLYKKSDSEFAKMLMDAVYEQTGICATAGIGSNLFLAKVALDIISKHSPDRMGVLDEESFRKKIWHHRPITDIWNIGKGTAKRLEKFGVYDLCGVAHMPEELLYRTFGTNAEYLIDHANGVESCTISEIKAYKPINTSISNSQIMFRDYGYGECRVILREMVECRVLGLIKKRKVCGSISLTVGYSKNIIPPYCRTLKLKKATNSYREIYSAFASLYEESKCNTAPIRRLAVSLGNLMDEEAKQFDLFTDTEKEEKENSLMNTILKLHERYGGNSVLRGADLQDFATLRARNEMIGGHKA